MDEPNNNFQIGINAIKIPLINAKIAENFALFFESIKGPEIGCINTLGNIIKTNIYPIEIYELPNSVRSKIQTILNIPSEN